MHIYQTRINPERGGSVENINGAKKVGIIIPQRVYMKYTLENPTDTGFKINNINDENFLIGKTFIYETDQSSQNLITSLSFSPVPGVDWNDNDYINNDLRQIIVDYVKEE